MEQTIDVKFILTRRVHAHRSTRDLVPWRGMKHTHSSLLQYEQQLSCCFSMTHGGIALITTTLRWPTYQYLTAKHHFNPGNTPTCHCTVMNYIRLPSSVVAPFSCAILPPRPFRRTFPTNFLIYLPPPKVYFVCGATGQQTHIHSVGLLWTSDQLLAGAVPTKHKHNRRISMSSAGFEPEIPAIKRL